MSLLNGSPDDNSDPNQLNGFGKNGKSPQKAVIDNTHNGNGLNNNDEYKMDMKTNGNDKVAEDDPLTGHRKWELTDGAKEPARPSWSQRFASTNFFMVIFLLAYVLQGCYFTYFVSVITTIEKLFHIKSASIALLLNFSEIGQICTSLFLTYFAGRGHRPRWIACGMFLFSIAAFGSVSPHFIFGPRLYNRVPMDRSEIATHHIQDNSGLIGLMGTEVTGVNSSLCLAEDVFNNLSQLSPSCNENNINPDTTSNTDLKSVVLVILAVSLLGIGIGQTAIATLGIPYIDDNVKSKQSPLYMAITIGVRVLGPALGYYLGSLCIRQYVDLTMEVDHTDPNFIGAWWLGLLFVSTSMFFASIVMFTFPKDLRNKTAQVMPAPVKPDESTKTDKKSINGSGKLDADVTEISSRPKLKDFLTTIKRQLKNDILMFRTASAVLHLLPITGLYVFLPKYLENQFQMATHNANFISGTFGILMMGVGILITGIISVKFSLSARKVALWIAFTALATAVGMFVLSIIGCPMDNFKGLETRSDGVFGSSKVFVPPCNNSTCLCDDETYAPICGSDGLNYFSACHAGCRTRLDFQGKRNFLECSCISESAPQLTATNGLCDNGRCDTKLKIFVAIFALTVFIHSTSEVGGMLIIMRCTHPKDKAMAMGIIQFSLGLLSNIPCPNIYARIIDATCIVWTKICGRNGHCSLYDLDSFRGHFFGVSCFIMLLAFVMDLVVFFKSHRIDIDPESHTANDTNGSSAKDYGEENLLKLRKMSQDGDEDNHMKIAIRDEV